MRLLASLATFATVAWSPLVVNAFLPSFTATRTPTLIRASVESEGSVCAIPSEFRNNPTLVGVPNGANAIRSAVVSNSSGDYIRIDDAIKANKLTANSPNVVVFLRHLG